MRCPSRSKRLWRTRSEVGRVDVPGTERNVRPRASPPTMRKLVVLFVQRSQRRHQTRAAAGSADRAEQIESREAAERLQFFLCRRRQVAQEPLVARRRLFERRALL